MFKIPKKLKIGAHTFKIVEKNMEMCGSCSRDDNTIEIRKGLSQSQKEVTLIHEIFHAINTEFGGDKASHIVLDSFSEQLYQVFVDNKLLKR